MSTNDNIPHVRYTDFNVKFIYSKKLNYYIGSNNPSLSPNFKIPRLSHLNKTAIGYIGTISVIVSARYYYDVT